MTHHTTAPATPSALTQLQRLWLLRLLVPMGGQREFIEAMGYRCDRTVNALGLLPQSEVKPGKFDPAEAKAQLLQLHHLAEKSAAQCQLPDQLQRNIHRLADLVGLSELERRLLRFVVELHNERLIDDAADGLGMLSSVKVYHALSVLLDAPVNAIREALGPQGKLGATGLVKVDNRGAGTLKAKLDLLSDTFANRIAASDDTDPVQLLRDVVLPSTPPVLGATDYVHIQDKLAVLIVYIRQAMKDKKPGVNVFVYGPPGTGKSQLARVVAQTLGVELFEVASEDHDGDPATGERRLRAYRAAQGFLTNRPSLILFDEVEDVFDDGNVLSGKRSTGQARKAWLNRVLENNPVPTLWLSNSIRSVDPAFMRRYDLVIELPVPPRSVRLRHVQSTCHGILDGDTMARVAEAHRAAPALITRASNVVAAIGQELVTFSPAKTFEWIVNDALRAQGHNTIPRTSTTLTSVYDPAFIQSDTDLSSVAEGLKANMGIHTSARLCLYGPPGTGKTAFGHWLASQLDRPILIKRASDLLDKYLGQTEQRIAKAFQEAEIEQAVFILDEVDSFLKDRRYAQHDWEVTRVNELLTQMEAFNGVFIASTNLMDSLDQAALRRFDLKVKFDFLAPHQAVALLERYCRLWLLSEPTAPTRERAERIRNVTPGDFASLARQHRFHPFKDALALVDGLVSACALKEGASHAPMGFVTASGAS